MDKNNEDFNYEEIMKEVETKLWNKDFMSLSNKEIQSLLQNLMWQLFLVKTYNINVNIRNTAGNLPHISIVIDGYAYRDGLNMSQDEMMDYEDEEIDEDEFYDD